MSYPYQAHQIQEILLQPKCLPEGSGIEVETSGKENRSGKFETRPMLIDGGYHDMRFLGKAPRLKDVKTYDASFLLANHRVRGIGYCEIVKRNFRFKKSIPKGWHLNVCDPNLPTNDPAQNIHHPLEDFSPKDFKEFTSEAAKMWNIDLGWEWEGGLL